MILSFTRTMAIICNWSSTTKTLATLIMAKDSAVSATGGLADRNASKPILKIVPSVIQGLESDHAPGLANSDGSTSIHQLDIKYIYSGYTVGNSVDILNMARAGKWVTVAIRHELNNGLRVVAEAESRSVTKQLEWILKHAGIEEYDDKELDKKLGKMNKYRKGAEPLVVTK